MHEWSPCPRPLNDGMEVPLAALRGSLYDASMDDAGEHDRRVLEARDLIDGARRVVVLTGSGISAESGIPTFRGTGGVWKQMRVEDFATPEGFDRDPLGVWNWYAARHEELDEARPNAAHVALAELERRVRRRGGSFVLVTQNIDGLHQAAGSEDVLELHGSLRRARCEACPYETAMSSDRVEAAPACPRCGGRIRPAVVWFGEALPEDVYAAAVEAAGEADLFMSVGTSAVVYPAAGLIEWAISAGAKAIEVNLEATPITRRVDVAIHGKAGDVLPRLVGGEDSV